MPDVRRIGDLDINADMRVQRRIWRVQRVGWVVGLLILLAALLGLLGSSGPLTDTTARSADDALQVSWERIARNESRTEIRARARPPRPGEQLKLTLSGPLESRLRVDSIQPEPTDSTLTSRGVEYTFQSEPGASELDIVLHVFPSGIGRAQGELRLADDSRVPLEMWVLP